MPPPPLASDCVMTDIQKVPSCRYVFVTDLLTPPLGCVLDGQEENAKLCDVFMRWLLGEAGVRMLRRREYEISESRLIPNTESLADRLRCCLQVTRR